MWNVYATVSEDSHEPSIFITLVERLPDAVSLSRPVCLFTPISYPSFHLTFSLSPSLTYFFPSLSPSTPASLSFSLPTPSSLLYISPTMSVYSSSAPSSPHSLALSEGTSLNTEGLLRPAVACHAASASSVWAQQNLRHFTKRGDLGLGLKDWS